MRKSHDGREAQVDGDPELDSSDESVAEVREVDGGYYVYLLAQGSSEITVEVDADLGEGVRNLTAVGQVIVNDPNSEATIVELQFGEAEDAPAGG
jgi:hypothetical protein